MTARLLHLLAGLSGRERLLIALMVFVALPLGLTQGVAVPLLARQDAARAALAEAGALQDWLRHRQSELAMLPAPDSDLGGTAPAGLRALEDALIAAGLRGSLVTLTNPSGASVSLRFAGVGFTGLMPWLDGVESRMGYRVNGLRLARGAAPDLVDAEIQLEPLP